MGAEHKRRSLADTLRATNPIAGAALASAASSMRRISAPQETTPEAAPALQEKPRGDARCQRIGIVKSASVSGEPTAPTVLTRSVPTDPTDPTLSATTDTTAPTDTMHQLQGEPTPAIRSGEPTDTTFGDNPLLSLAPSRLVFLRHVLANRARFDHEFTPWSRVVQDTGLSHIGVKRIVKDLAGRGIIRVEFDQLHRRGSRVYVREEYARALVALRAKPGQGDPTWPRSSADLTDLTTTQQHDPTDPTDPTPLRMEGLRKIHLSEDEPGERLVRLSDETFAQHWPDLFGIGFASDQIRRVVESRRAVGKSNHRLVEGLDHADFALRELRESHREILDGQGIPVRKLAGYVFNSLCLNGTYGMPDGYVSPEEQAEKDAEKKAWQVEGARKKREEAEFQVWLGGLAPGERDAILRQSPGGPQEKALKHAWQKGKCNVENKKV